MKGAKAAFLIVFLALHPASGDASCVSKSLLALNRWANWIAVRGNLFATGRGLSDYVSAFPPLEDSLRRLRNRWVDVGAGKANAQRDYLADASYPGKAATVAIGISRPTSFKKLPPGLKYLSGRHIEQIAKAEIGEADLGHGSPWGIQLQRSDGHRP